MSATEGSPTYTGWKRRSKAGSFGMCRRYSSSVVAPIARSSPCASAGFRRFPALTAPDCPADDGVQFVDEEEDAPFGGGDFAENGVESFLELAPELGAGQQLTDVEGHDPGIAHAGGAVMVDDALGQSFGDRRLAGSRFPDEHGIVLAAAGKHLHAATNFLITSDDRIESSCGGKLVEVEVYFAGPRSCSPPRGR